MAPSRPITPSGVPAGSRPGSRPRPHSHRGARPPPSPRPCADHDVAGFATALPAADKGSKGSSLASKLFQRSLPLKAAGGASARYNNEDAEDANFWEASGLKGYEVMRKQLMDQAGRAQVSDFFDGKGVLSRQSPKSWALTAALGHPLSKSRHTEEKHGSLSTRQQLVNTQRSLENSRKLVEEQIQTTLKKKEVVSEGASDVQRLRHYRLLFAPLKALPADPIFKENLDIFFIEDQQEKAAAAAKAALPAESSSVARMKKAARASRFRSMTTRNLEKEGAEAEKSASDKEGDEEKDDKSLKGSFAKLASVGRRPTIIATQKGSGGAMTNEQRAMLLTVFKKCIVRVSSKDNRSALMQRSTWFRFLIKCDLIGTRTSWDRSDPTQIRVTWLSAAKIFKVFAEDPGKTNSTLPVLTFSGWASAAQAVLRSPGIFETQAEVVEALFATFLPRISEALGITYEDAKKQMLMGESSRSTLDRKKSIGGGLGSNNPSRTTSRALSFFSSAGSMFIADDAASETGFNDEGKSPLSWQMNLAEEQMCEPECLQLLHEYRKHLEVLYSYYASMMPTHLGIGDRSPSSRGGIGSIDEFSRQVTPDEMNPDSFKRMLKDLKFFPEFVQTFSLDRHISTTQTRHNAENLSFNAFVETLCRIAFCYLIAYGNIAQQASLAKHKMLWMLCLLEARLPRSLRKLAKQDMDAEGLDAEDEHLNPIETPRGPDSLWNRRKEFVLSDCDNREIVLWPVMSDDPGTAKKKKSRFMSGVDPEELERIMSTLSERD
eukprot:gb/GFBE01046796.1/.p1 GENE.gb/GFBE01046796.1/~~gb/GFBE01046796.1/.p1  ORF type:complete len:775 (+),score=165.29 gb/GFBE01046796.1/:1-2325(+)